jgi:hypothetical protein
VPGWHELKCLARVERVDEHPEPVGPARVSGIRSPSGSPSCQSGSRSRRPRKRGAGLQSIVCRPREAARRTPLDCAPTSADARRDPVRGSRGGPNLPVACASSPSRIGSRQKPAFWLPTSGWLADLLDRSPIPNLRAPIRVGGVAAADDISPRTVSRRAATADLLACDC